jgi:hypothetical protein
LKARKVNPKNFFAELKRRNVYKVAIVYGVVAWLLLQAASILFPTFEAPPWTMKVFVAVIALGFPIALILAWAFELTPEGIKRTDEIEPGQRSRNRAWIYVVMIAGVLSMACGKKFLQWDAFWKPAMNFHYLKRKCRGSTAS